MYHGIKVFFSSDDNDVGGKGKGVCSDGDQNDYESIK